MPYATSHVRREPASARSAGAPLWSGTPFALRRWPHRWRQRDDLPHPILDASLEEADCSQDVDVGVEIRLPDRAPDIHLGRLWWHSASGPKSSKISAHPERMSAS